MQFFCEIALSAESRQLYLFLFFELSVQEYFTFPLEGGKQRKRQGHFEKLARCVQVFSSDLETVATATLNVVSVSVWYSLTLSAFHFILRCVLCSDGQQVC